MLISEMFASSCRSPAFHDQALHGARKACLVLFRTERCFAFFFNLLYVNWIGCNKCTNQGRIFKSFFRGQDRTLILIEQNEKTAKIRSQK